MLERITITRDLNTGLIRTTEGMEYVEAGGRLINVGPRTITAEEAAEFQASVNVDVMLDRDAKAATITERDATIADLQSQLATVTAARDSAVADATAKAATIETMAAEIEALRNPPRQPRILYPSEFLTRFTLPELLGIFRAVSSDVPEIAGVAMQAVAQMFTVQSVDLDNAMLTQLLDGLAAAGLIGDGRKAQLLESA